MIVEDPYGAILDHMTQLIRARIQGQVHVRYSAYNTGHDDLGNDVPINNLDDRAFEGTHRVYLDHDFFGNGENFESDPLTDPTWLDLCVVANEAMIVTGTSLTSFLKGWVLMTMVDITS